MYLAIKPCKTDFRGAVRTPQAWVYQVTYVYALLPIYNSYSYVYTLCCGAFNSAVASDLTSEINVSSWVKLRAYICMWHKQLYLRSYIAIIIIHFSDY